MATALERPLSKGPERDWIGKTTERSLDETFGQDRADVEEFQLTAARQRFEELIGSVRTLKAQAEAKGVTGIATLDDVAPLLFQHTAYKSYPLPLLEKNRFDLMTKWLAGATSIDLSGVDASKVESIDDWLALIERETPLFPCHTTGTTGKLSFIPRTTVESDHWCESLLKAWEPFGNELGFRLGDDNIRLPVIYPSARYGRYITQRLIEYLALHLAPTSDQCFTMTNATLSADLAALSGRIRVAQAKGELSKMKLSDSMKLAIRLYLDEMERRPQEIARFFEKIFDELHDHRVFIISQTSYLYQAAREGLERGYSQVFAPDGIGAFGGGSKDVALPKNHLEVIAEFTGISVSRDSYGMSELNMSLPCCPEGHRHFPPHIIPFLIDPETGEALPRRGRNTGRFAALDLTAQSYWGGVITGDKLTVEWDTPCKCGRKGVYSEAAISRYSAEVTGDDKVTCAATIDNTDAALQQLLQ